jgi:hypothetical protein
MGGAAALLFALYHNISVIIWLGHCQGPGVIVESETIITATLYLSLRQMASPNVNAD